MTAGSKRERRKEATKVLRRYRALAAFNVQAAAMMEGVAERVEAARAALLTVRTPALRDAVMEYIDALEGLLPRLARRIAENMEQMAAVEAVVAEVNRADPLAGKVLALRYLGSLALLERGGDGEDSAQETGRDA